MVYTKKFSEFNNVTPQNINDASQKMVGLDNGLNMQSIRFLSWETSTRPPTPFNGLLGLNTTLQQYEWWDSVALQWVQLADTNVFDILASHLSGEGASLIGLQNQSNVTNKYVQDLANASFIAQTDNGTLQNAQFLGNLSTGILKSTTSTGILSISPSLTSIDSLTTIANQFLITNGPNSYATLGPLTNGQLIIGSTGSTPVGATLTQGSGITITNGAGSIGIGLTIPVTVSLGGTGVTAFTAYAPICGGTTTTGILQSATTGFSNSGYVFVSNGLSALPSWQPLSSLGVTSVSGTLNRITASPTTGNVVIDISASYIGQSSIITVGTVTTGIWNSTVISGLYGGTGVANSGLTINLGSGGTGKVLSSDLSGNASWASLALLGVTSVSGTSNRITVSPTIGNVVVDISASYVGQSSITTVGTITTGTWNGTILNGQYGGTGIANIGLTINLGSGAVGKVLSSDSSGNANWATLSSIGVTSVSGTTNRITVSPTIGNVIIDISASYIGQSSITTIGTITSGSWNSTIISGQYGGTGIANTGLTINLSNGSLNKVLTSDVSGNASWTNLSSFGVTSVSNSDGSITISPTTGAVVASLNVSHTNTWSVLQNFSTVNISSLTASQAVVTDGSKNLISLSYTSSSTVSTIVYRDSNSNSYFNNIGTAIVTFSSGTTSMTAATPKQVILSGVAAGVNLPDATTLVVGTQYQITNQTGITRIINTNGGSLLINIVSGGIANVYLTDNSTSAGTWTYNFIIASNSSWGTVGITTPGYFSGAQVLLNGSGSGTISIVPQASAGTYNFNLPTTPGTSGYFLTSAGGGSSPMTWTQLSSVGVTSVSGTTNRITASPTIGNVVVDISASYVGQSSITTVGTITTGTWNGTPISLTTYASGTLQAAQFPALLGDVTTSAGSLTTAIKSSVNLSGNPTTTTQSASDNSTRIATTAYVTTGISNAIAGVNPAVAVQAATTSSSDTSGLTYNNGASGIGATFTGSVNTALTVDGYTFTALGQRLLIKNDTQTPSGAFNGVYYVTQIQTALLPIILTRALDYDTPSDINNTGAIPVVNGTVNATTSWLLTSQVNTVGTDPLTYVQFSRSPTSILPLNLGGTNANLTASNGGIFYSTASAGAILSGTATANRVLLSGSSSAPSWSTATYPATTTINQVLYSSSANTIAGITAANNSVFISGTTGIPSWLAPSSTSGIPLISQGSSSPPIFGTVVVAGGGTGSTSFTAYAPIVGGTTTTGAFQSASTGFSNSGYVFVSNGSSALPSFVALSGIGVTSLTGTANQVLVNGTSGSATTGAITLTLPQSIATTSNVTFGAATINGTTNVNGQLNANTQTNGTPAAVFSGYLGNSYIAISGTTISAGSPFYNANLTLAGYSNVTGVVNVLTVGYNACVGINQGSPINALDINGALALGSYAGVNTAPTGGALIPGQVVIGATSGGASSILELSSTTKAFRVTQLNTPTSQVSTPLTAMLAYNLSTNKMQFYNSAFWQNTGSWMQLGNYIASGASSLPIPNLNLPSEYNYVFIITSIQPSTNGAYLCMRISNNNGSSYLNTNYQGGVISVNYNSTTWANTNDTTQIPLTYNLSNAAYASGQLFLSNLNTSTYSPNINGEFTGYSSSNSCFLSKAQGLNTGVGANAVTNVEFLMSSGNITYMQVSVYAILT